MLRRFAIIALFLVPVFACVPVGMGARAATHRSESIWTQRDRAIYVVSTLNLLHTRSGRLLVPILAHRFGVTHYDVYADVETSDLYFIELKRIDGSSAAAFAYRMGWMMPMGISAPLNTLHVRRAPSATVAAYGSDDKQLIGSFTSTISS